MQLISAKELNKAKQNFNDYEIIDIREPYEYRACNISSMNVPMGEVCGRIAELPKNKKIVLMCRSGRRAEALANLLQTEFGFDEVYVLDGGILSWKEQVDDSLEID